MGSFFTCKTCNTRAYLQEQKDELSFPQNITCNNCNSTNSFLIHEVKQERYDLSCPFCVKKFYIRKTPIINVDCPYCNSFLQITNEGNVSLIQEGQKPTDNSDNTVAGGLGGLFLGALLGGPAGAVVGALAGAALGSSTVKEAKYRDHYL